MISQKSKLLKKYDLQKELCFDFKINHPSKLLIKQNPSFENEFANNQIRNQIQQSKMINVQYISFKLKQTKKLEYENKQQFNKLSPNNMRQFKNNNQFRKSKSKSPQLNTNFLPYFKTNEKYFKANQKYSNKDSINSSNKNLPFQKDHSNKKLQNYLYQPYFAQKDNNNNEHYFKKEKNKQNLYLNRHKIFHSPKSNYQYFQKEDRTKIQQNYQQKYFQQFASFNNDKVFSIKKQQSKQKQKQKRPSKQQQKNYNPFQQTQHKNKYKKYDIESNSKYDGDFFFTNPQWKSDYKNKFKNIDINNKQQQQNLQQNQVQQFCFSLSSINQYPYPNNLFSNSNDNLFQVKQNEYNQQNQSLSTKKLHLKKLIQQFVHNLDQIDEKSLNQKTINQIQDMIESLIFKDKRNTPKNSSSKNFQCKFQNNAFKGQLNSMNEVKKWKKSKSKDNYNKQQLTQRKNNLSGKQNIPIMTIEKNSSQSMNYSGKKSITNKNNISSELSISALTQKKQKSKQNSQYYHPNISFKDESIKKQQKQNIFFNLQNKSKRSLASLHKINPKNGVYFKNTKSTVIFKNTNISNHR